MVSFFDASEMKRSYFSHMETAAARRFRMTRAFTQGVFVVGTPGPAKSYHQVPDLVRDIKPCPNGLSPKRQDSKSKRKKKKEVRYAARNIHHVECIVRFIS